MTRQLRPGDELPSINEILAEEDEQEIDCWTPHYIVSRRSAADCGRPPGHWIVARSTRNIREARRVARWWSRQDWTNIQITVEWP